MKNELDAAIQRIMNHAWGTSDMNSELILSDVLLQIELGASVDLEKIRVTLIEDLQTLNASFRMLNPDEVQPPDVSMKLTYAMSKINLLLLEGALEFEQHVSSPLIAIAKEVAAAWYCVLSCDIEDVAEGF